MNTDICKLCFFCRDTTEIPYTESDAKTHIMFGLHRTFGKTWSPMKGHKDYELHLKWLKLLDNPDGK